MLIHSPAAARTSRPPQFPFHSFLPAPRSCPSDAEENACLYNMACCYCKLGQVDAAFTCIEAVLENGKQSQHLLCCLLTLWTSLHMVATSKAACTMHATYCMAGLRLVMPLQQHTMWHPAASEPAGSAAYLAPRQPRPWPAPPADPAITPAFCPCRL